MAQHDFSIANQTASNARADINSALQALASNNSGNSAPSTTYANMWWYENDTNLLKIRNESDNAWISVAYLDGANWEILDNTQVVNTSGTQIGVLGDQATSTWTTGTGTTESLVSPAKVKAAIDQHKVTIVRGATSTATTALTHVVNHGQSSRPDFVWGEVIITVAQAGYAVGDCIKVGNVYERDEDDRHLTFWGNSTQMGLSTNLAYTYMYVANRSTSADQLLTGQSVRICGVWYD